MTSTWKCYNINTIGSWCNNKPTDDKRPMPGVEHKMQKRGRRRSKAVTWAIWTVVFVEISWWKQLKLLKKMAKLCLFFCFFWLTWVATIVPSKWGTVPYAGRLAEFGTNRWPQSSDAETAQALMMMSWWREPPESSNMARLGTICFVMDFLPQRIACHQFTNGRETLS